MPDKGSRAFGARGLIVLGVVLGLGLMARPAAAAPFAYVVNNGTNTVSVIDTGVNPPTVVGVPIAVGEAPFGIAVSPDGQRAYVTNGVTHSVSVIDTTQNPPRVVNSVSLPSEPGKIALSVDGRYAYALVTSSVLVIDTTQNPPSVVNTITGLGTQPYAVAVSTDGQHAYVANLGSGNVSVIDTGTNTVVGNPVPVGNSPYAVATTPDGKQAYVTNAGSNSVSVIDTTQNPPSVNTIALADAITGQTQPVAVAITPDGAHAYVASNIVINNSPVLGTVSVIDTGTNPAVVGNPVTVGIGPSAVAITPDGQHAYVTNEFDGTVSVISTTTTSPPITIGLGGTSQFPTSVGIVSGLVVVTSVTPNSGSNQGLTQVTIQGFNFAPGGTGISFGGSLASHISCSSTTTCTATSPADGAAATAYTVDVQATANGLTSATSAADEFTYLGGPQCGSRLSCVTSTPRISVGCLSAVIFKNTVLCTPPAPDGNISCNLSSLPLPDVRPLLACDPTTNSCTGFSLSRFQWPDPCTPPPIENCAQCESFNGTCETVNGKFFCLHPF